MTLTRPLNKHQGHSFWYTNRFLIYDFLYRLSIGPSDLILL